PGRRGAGGLSAKNGRIGLIRTQDREMEFFTPALFYEPDGLGAIFDSFATRLLDQNLRLKVLPKDMLKVDADEEGVGDDDGADACRCLVGDQGGDLRLRNGD